MCMYMHAHFMLVCACIDVCVCLCVYAWFVLSVECAYMHMYVLVWLYFVNVNVWVACGIFPWLNIQNPKNFRLSLGKKKTKEKTNITKYFYVTQGNNWDYVRNI